MAKKGFYIFLLVFPVFNYCYSQSSNHPIWQNKSFRLYADSVVQQDKFIGKVLSATEMVSNYKSPTNDFLSPAISFKFSINGKDNEMKPGVDHHFNCIGDNGCETPPIQFGKQFIDNRPLR